MPINVIVADDEYFIRQRIIKIIPWEELGLNFIGEAENGLQVLDLLKTHPVDLIILDIKMPQMTGIEVAEYVSQHFPWTKMIILSGYSDFDYARAAMKHRVSDYLLKPVDRLALKETLESCIVKIKRAKKQMTQIEKYQSYEKSIDLSRVLVGNLTLPMLLAKYPKLEETPYSLYIGSFIFQESDQIITQLIQGLYDLGWESNYSKELDYTYTIQLFSKDQQDIASLESFFLRFISQHKTYIFLTIGEVFSLDKDWQPYYKQVHSLLNQRYFSSSSTVLIGSSSLGHKKFKQDFSKLRSDILGRLNSQDIESFKDYVNGVFKDIEEKENIDYLRVVVTEFFITYNIHYHHLVDFSYNITEFATMMIDEEYQLHELKNTIITYGLQCMKKNKTAPSNVMLSDRIAAYIQENYSDPGLTVASLAHLFDLNPSYMGSVFRKVKGQSILQHITSVRMDASKKLLESDEYKVSDVAEMVGYSDAFYYSKRFKKMFGYSPRSHILQAKHQ